ncbi:monocarboxylate transporter 13-like [Saccostrea echinata]|uniref:monocarboxylate transporter 13-like n=1 Tax=Saccostrea echinata TaxID=191078 RepID=UPI002A7F808A|nr:monocarboxylate transporter 13-like [Saccostrea echinata]
MGTEREDADDAPAHPVDKGWSWVILSASLCAMLIYGGIHRGFGILFVEFRKKFDSSSASMSIVVSVQIAVMSVAGLLLMTGGMKYFSSRQCVVIGGFFVTTSLILSTFAKNVTHLIFTHSVLIGFGFAAVLGPSLIITGQYFDTRRGIANGLYTGAASFGALVFAPAFRYFIDAFVLKGALLILAGLAFHIVPAGMLLRPPELYEKWSHQKKLRDENNKETSATSPLVRKPNRDVLNENPGVSVTENPSILNGTHHSSVYSSIRLLSSMKPKDAISVHSYDAPKISNGIHYYSNRSICDHDLKQKEKLYGSADMIMIVPYGKGSIFSLAKGRKSDSLLLNGNHLNGQPTNGYTNHEDAKANLEYQKEEKKIRNFFNASIFRNAQYIFFALGFTLGVPVVVTVVYLPDVAEDCGIPSDKAALLVSIYMVGEIIGRCGSGFFSGKLIHRQIVIAISLLIAGIAQNLVRFLQTFWLLAVFAAVNGVFGGPIHGLYASVVVDILGIENLRSGLCVLQLSQGIIWSAILPITGYLRDVSGDYILTYHFVGSLTILAATVLCVSHYSVKRSPKVTEVDVTDEET